MVMTDGSVLKWKRDVNTNLLFIERLHQHALFSSDVETILRELHKRANHAPAEKLRDLLRDIPTAVINSKTLKKVTENCKMCMECKDPRNTAFDKSISENDAYKGSMDIVEFQPTTRDGFKYVLIMQPATGSPVTALNLKDKSEATVRSVLMPILGKGFILPKYLRTDKESAFTTSLLTDLSKQGVNVDSQALGHANGNPRAENNIKRFIEAMRMVILERGLGALKEWHLATAKAQDRINSAIGSDGRSAVEQWTGFNPLAEPIGRQRDMLNKEEVKRKVGNVILYSRPGRKHDTPDFKLSPSHEAAQVVEQHGTTLLAKK